MIKLLKLITGEEVIGEVTYQNEYVLVNKPCAIMLLGSRSTPDQHSMGLIPYAGYTKEHKIKVKASSIVWEADLDDEVFNQYNAIFGSGIQIVTNQLGKAVNDGGRQTPQVSIT